MNPRGSAWKPDATGTRCLRCARTSAGHAGRSCYAVPCAAIDSYDPPRPDLLVTDADPYLALQAGRIDGEGEVLRDADGRPRICECCPKPIPARSPTGRRHPGGRDDVWRDLPQAPSPLPARGRSGRPAARHGAS